MPLLGSEGYQVGLDVGVEIDRQIEPGVGPMELAAGAAGEIYLGGDVVVILGVSVHRF